MYFYTAKIYSSETGRPYPIYTICVKSNMALRSLKEANALILGLDCDDAVIDIKQITRFRYWKNKYRLKMLCIDIT